MLPATGLQLRPFTPADRDACLAIFDSNLPKFFKEHERPDFVAFLDRLPCPFFMVVDADGHPVGCCGYTPERGRLVYGMVTQAWHRQGVGRLLLWARLADWFVAHGPAVVTLLPSQHSSGFFAHDGFVTTKVTAGGFAPGLHRHDMELRLDEGHYAALTNPRL
jgi:hypothetical protein